MPQHSSVARGRGLEAFWYSLVCFCLLIQISIAQQNWQNETASQAFQRFDSSLLNNCEYEFELVGDFQTSIGSSHKLTGDVGFFRIGDLIVADVNTHISDHIVDGKNIPDSRFARQYIQRPTHSTLTLDYEVDDSRPGSKTARQKQATLVRTHSRIPKDEQFKQLLSFAHLDSLLSFFGPTNLRLVDAALLPISGESQSGAGQRETRKIDTPTPYGLLSITYSRFDNQYWPTEIQLVQSPDDKYHRRLDKKLRDITSPTNMTPDRAGLTSVTWKIVVELDRHADGTPFLKSLKGSEHHVNSSSNMSESWTLNCKRQTKQTSPNAIEKRAARIRDGERIHEMGEPLEQFVWQQGKIIPRVDEVGIAVGRSAAFLPGGWRTLLPMVAGGLALLACAFWLFRRWQKAE